jgi:hypothetical protein
LTGVKLSEIKDWMKTKKYNALNIDGFNSAA